MLNNTYGIGSKAIAAPQATLMSMVVKGVMTGQLPWALVFIGATFGSYVCINGTSNITSCTWNISYQFI